MPGEELTAPPLQEEPPADIPEEAGFQNDEVIESSGLDDILGPPAEEQELADAGKPMEIPSLEVPGVESEGGAEKPPFDLPSLDSAVPESPPEAGEAPGPAQPPSDLQPDLAEPTVAGTQEPTPTEDLSEAPSLEDVLGMGKDEPSPELQAELDEALTMEPLSIDVPPVESGEKAPAEEPGDEVTEVPQVEEAGAPGTPPDPVGEQPPPGIDELEVLDEPSTEEVGALEEEIDRGLEPPAGGGQETVPPVEAPAEPAGAEKPSPEDEDTQALLDKIKTLESQVKGMTDVLDGLKGTLDDKKKEDE
jgi:hypothetical protein